MANVTYYIGAGASAGKRSKEGWITEGLPVVNEITTRLGDYLHRIQLAKFQDGDRDWNTPHLGLVGKAAWENAKQRLEASLERLYEACRRNATIDTYAKKLVLQGRDEEFEHLERMLTWYFVLEQVMCEPDSRYDTFLANIIEDLNRFPSHVKVLSWNYDSQFEIAYDEYQSGHLLNIGSKQSTKYQEFDILKINGSATFKGTELIPAYRRSLKKQIQKQKNPNDVGHFTDVINSILPDIVYLYHMFVGEINPTVKNTTNLSFAFDYNEPSDILYQRAGEIIQATEVLVIIGYTFPYFNRKIDRKLLDLLDPDTEIYIQDMNPERVKQSFLAVCPSVKDYKIHLLRIVILQQAVGVFNVLF